MAKKAVKTATVLAFEKKIVPSDARMYATSWNDKSIFKEQALRITPKSVRGTISNRLKEAVKNDPAKLNAEVEKANLQTVDTCSLPAGFDTLMLNFTLKFLGGIATPSACNSDDFRKSYQIAVQEYNQKNSFIELAQRYASNIASARFLWRNRVGAEYIEVHVKVLNENQERFDCIFDSTEFSLKNFENTDENLKKLTNLISDALSSENKFLLLEIFCYAKVGNSQEVYPSEELILDKNKSNKKGEKSKILYSVDNIAAMHSQKIGNAIRCIDTWYPEFKDANIGPIAAEPYGAVTNLGKAFRANKTDFFTLFDDFATGGVIDDSAQHYVMAVLVRGGVFGESGKE